MTYTQSQSLMNAIIAAKVISPRTTISNASNTTHLAVRGHELSHVIRNSSRKTTARVHPATVHGHTGAWM